MKSFLKQALLFVVTALFIPFCLLITITPKSKKKAVFSSVSQFLSLFPGQAGSLIRKSVFRFSIVDKPETGVIGFGTIFSEPKSKIEENVYIGPQCNIGGCNIGKNSLIASGVHILSGKNQHNFDDLSKPIQQQGGVYSIIDIGEDCWIGNTAVIMANVGKHSIIAAGSVVTKEIPEYSIAAGNPARVIRCRKSDSKIMEDSDEK